MLQQSLQLKASLTFQLDGLRWSGGRASRDVLLHLGYVEGIVNLLEPAPEVKPICCLPYALHHPEWSHKSSSKLPSTCKVEDLRGK